MGTRRLPGQPPFGGAGPVLGPGQLHEDRACRLGRRAALQSETIVLERTPRRSGSWAESPTPARPAFEPFRLERTSDTGLRHQDGTVSMARAEPDTATSDFFVCIGAQPELDFDGKRNPDGQGFAASGRGRSSGRRLRLPHPRSVEGDDV